MKAFRIFDPHGTDYMLYGLQHRSLALAVLSKLDNGIVLCCLYRTASSCSKIWYGQGYQYDFGTSTAERRVCIENT